MKRRAVNRRAQALAVADTLVLLAAVPLYVLPNVYPFTGVFGSYYELYMGRDHSARPPCRNCKSRICGFSHVGVQQYITLYSLGILTGRFQIASEDRVVPAFIRRVTSSASVTTAYCTMT